MLSVQQINDDGLIAVLLVLESLVLRGIDREMGERSGTYGVNEKSREIGKNGEKNPTMFFQGQSSNRRLRTSDRKIWLQTDSFRNDTRGSYVFTSSFE